MCVNVVRSLLIMIMQDIWKLEKHWAWSGIVHSDLGIITSETLTLEAKEQVRLLKCIPDSLLLS